MSFTKASIKPDGEFMRLNSAALSALNILPSEDAGLHDNKSLFGLLNKCRTVPGQRILRQWLEYPLVDKPLIELRHELVEFFVNNSDIRSSLHDTVLRGIPDVDLLAGKLCEKKANLSHCFKIYQALISLAALHSALNDKNPVMQAAYVDKLGECGNNMENFKLMIKDNVDFEHLKAERELRVRPDKDEDLQEIDNNLCQIEEKTMQCFEKAAKNLGLQTYKTIKLEKSVQTGYCLKISNKHESVLRNNDNFHAIGKGASKNDGIRFSNKILDQLSSEYVSAKKEFSEKQGVIVQELLAIAYDFCDHVKEMAKLIGEIDIIVSLAIASVSATSTYVRPKMLDKGSGKLCLKGLRHPCVEARQEFIANDASFEEKNHTFFIVTGPNMGGKSTYIRSIGVAVVMAQMGCFVPAEYAEISIVDGIYTRIGASDDVIGGNSTFMVEMIETAEILKEATSDSLIIIDELGRGTSTYDGFGLAWAITEKIAKDLKSFCLFATHYHELASISEQVPSIGNLHVEAEAGTDLANADEVGVVMHFKVKEGCCDQSFGIHVAKAVSFPEEMIKVAEKKLEELEGNARQKVALNIGKADFEKIKNLDVDNLSDQEVLELVASFAKKQ